MAIDLTKTEIIKDDQQITAYQFNQSLIPPKPVEQLIQVNFPGAGINSGQVGKFRLPTDANLDLLVKSFHIDVDNDNNDDIGSAQYHVGNIPLLIFLYDPVGQKIVRKVAVSFSGYPTENFYLVFHRGLEVQIKSSASYSQISFFCEPIFVTNTVAAIKQ